MYGWSGSWYDEPPFPESIPPKHPKHLTKMKECKCPVCKSILGYRPEKMDIKLDCHDCKATYTFYPGKKKPTAKLFAQKKKGCHCFSCQHRDSQKASQQE